MGGTLAPSLAGGQVTAILGAVIANLTVLRTSPAWTTPGSPATASLAPLSPLIDVSELAAGVINLAATVKDVVFEDANAVPVPDQGTVSGGGVLAGLAGTGYVEGGQPFPVPVAAVGASATPVTQNIAGMLTQLFGTVSVPQLRIRADIEWVVRRADGAEEAEGADFLTLDGIGKPDVGVLLPPIFEELRLDTLMIPSLDGRCLTARVTLTLDAVRVTAELPPISILVLPLLVPTCIALFEEDNFGATYGGGALILVPEHSPVASLDGLMNALNKVYKALDAVSGLASVALWLLGIGDLLDALPKQPRIRVMHSDGIKDLDEIALRSHPPLPDFAEDSYSDKTKSLIMIGVSGTTAEFYNDEGYTAGGPQGWYNLIVPDAGVNAGPGGGPSGGLWVMIPDLGDLGESDAAHELPKTIPPGCAVLGKLDTYWHNPTWSASMSSVRYHPDWIAGVEQVIGAVAMHSDSNLPDLRLPAPQPATLPSLGCLSQPLTTGPVTTVKPPPLKPQGPQAKPPPKGRTSPPR